MIWFGSARACTLASFITPRSNFNGDDCDDVTLYVLLEPFANCWLFVVVVVDDVMVADVVVVCCDLLGVVVARFAEFDIGVFVVELVLGFVVRGPFRNKKKYNNIHCNKSIYKYPGCMFIFCRCPFEDRFIGRVAGKQWAHASSVMQHINIHFTNNVESKYTIFVQN